MTPDRLRECLTLLRWSQRELATVLEMDERQVRRWAAGARVPPGIAAWLEGVGTYLEKNPPPSKIPVDGPH